MCAERRPRRAQRGFTLVEMIVAIVVVGVGLAGLMLALSVTVRGSADPVVRLQMVAIAEELLEEAQLKPFQAQPHAAAGACARDTFNDVGDYQLAAGTPVCTLDGTAIPELAGYSVEMKVEAAALGAVPAADARRITVTVRRDGAEPFTLVAWRTNYAGS